MSAWPDLTIMRLHSHIEGNLWVGGNPVISAPAQFTFVYDLLGRGDYGLQPHQQRVVIPMQDVERMPGNDASVLWLGREVVKACALGVTLVHCNAGLNRSGLIAALALMLQGRSADAAIELLRQRRSPEVLHNKTFERWLRQLTL